MSDDCAICRAQDLAGLVLLPATAAWEQANELPQFSMALHGAAALVGVMMQSGVARTDIESTLGQLLDDIEGQIAEDAMMGGPTQGTA
jgi:hypothetical protein